MSQDKKKDFMITAVMFFGMAAVIIVGFIVPRAQGRDAASSQNEQRLFDLVDAAVTAPAESATSSEPAVIDRTQGDIPILLVQASGEEVKGAPLNPPAAPAEGGEIKGAPLGQSGAAPSDLAADPSTEGMTPLRTIPQESWDMLQKLEGGPKSPEELFNFTKTKDGKYLKVSFGALGGYEYVIPDPDELREAQDKAKVLGDQIPVPLKDIDGAEVVIVGFMVPIEVTREGNVKSFALTQNQAFCCFGVPPGMNEWIMVKMDEGKTAEFTLDLPVAAFGKIAVGEEIEDGYVMSVYRMSAGEVIDAQELIRRTQQG